ncbi:MAG: hypothetical protein A3H98_13530 [Bacteroidetes bacterium RIFCSPLOWO2_02_FULL_36_8]|nr:MAG: hypothetical protein A3H98_13530 [Bacteroidetes bacterium RIFCSPLOWO2_02_FULL_36_8]OFY71778.1 MAG: hypothetical protein A3G23_13750 [Bacteroidetes bacterium RIFCSPLOWO2_12_FULL_37_12]
MLNFINYNIRIRSEQTFTGFGHRFLLFIIVIITFNGCQQIVEMDLGSYDSKLVVNGILKPDTFPRIYLSESTFFYDIDDYRNRFHFITNAVVTLKRNDTKIFLKSDSAYEPLNKNRYNMNSGFGDEYKPDTVLVYFYTDTIRPKPGDYFELEITSGNRRVTSAVTVPFPVEIDSVKFAYSERPKDPYNEGFQTEVYAETYFKETINKDEYYRLKLTGWYKEPSYIDPSDSNLLTFSHSTDVTAGNILGDINKVINGYLECGFYYENASKNKKHVRISIERLTEETGRYLESLVLQREHEDSPFTEPVMVKSNIEGGLGVFGAYSASKEMEGIYYCK